jgi:hypothetical protein
MVQLMQWPSAQLQFWVRNQRCMVCNFRWVEFTNKITSLRRCQLFCERQGQENVKRRPTWGMVYCWLFEEIICLVVDHPTPKFSGTIFQASPSMRWLPSESPTWAVQQLGVRMMFCNWAFVWWSIEWTSPMFWRTCSSILLQSKYNVWVDLGKETKSGVNQFFLRSLEWKFNGKKETTFWPHIDLGSGG